MSELAPQDVPAEVQAAVIAGVERDWNRAAMGIAETAAQHAVYDVGRRYGLPNEVRFEYPVAMPQELAGLAAEFMTALTLFRLRKLDRAHGDEG